MHGETILYLSGVIHLIGRCLVGEVFRSFGELYQHYHLLTSNMAPDIPSLSELLTRHTDCAIAECVWANDNVPT